MNPERRDEANATGVSLTRDTEAFELMRDTPGFERNQTVNNRGYRPSAHLRGRSRVDGNATASVSPVMAV